MAGDTSGMNAGNRMLEDWMRKAISGELQLPRFQRFEAWGSRNVTDLLQTVVDGLPAGSALILEIGDQSPFKHRSLEGAPPPTARLTELLLDGQQRLTALLRALTDSYPDRTYLVRWKPDPTTPDPDHEYPVESEGRYTRKDGKRGPLWLDEPSATFDRGLIPARLLAPGAAAEESLDAWLEAATSDPTKRATLDRIATRLRGRFATFNLPLISLPSSTKREVVLDVFVKLNTRLVRLTAFDIVVAEVEEEAEQGLHELVAELRSEAPDFLYFADPEDVVLAICALLQDRVPNETGFLGLDFSRVAAEWRTVITGAKRAGEFLRQERIVDADRLPTEVVLAPLAALWAKAPADPDLLGNLRILLRRYLWRAFLTRRYERAVANSVLQDFRALRGLAEASSAAEPPIFDDALYPVPGAREFISASWPKSRDRLARAVLQIALIAGADDIADGAEISPQNSPSREYHHLFPVAYLRKQGVVAPDAYLALNCALITWRTNRKISDKPPLAYLLERTDASKLGEQEIRRRLATHQIDYDLLAGNDYTKFLEARADRMAERAAQLAIGQPWRGA
jgi:hypothetical protein